MIKRFTGRTLVLVALGVTSACGGATEDGRAGAEPGRDGSGVVASGDHFLSPDEPCDGDRFPPGTPPSARCLPDCSGVATD